MRESQQQLQAIIDNSTAVIYVKDLQGRFLLVNRRYEELFHVSRTGVIGLTDYDIFPRERADSYRQTDQQALAAGEPVESEDFALLEDGPHTYISIKCPLYDDNGQPYAVCGISTDITERKQAADRETRRRTWLEKVLQLSKDIAGTRELQACLVAVYNSVRYGLDFDRVGLFLYDQNNMTVRGVLGTSPTGERDETDLPATPVTEFAIFQEALKSSNWFQHTLDYTAENFADNPDHPMYGVNEHAMVAVWAGDRPVAALAVDNFLTGRPMSEEQLEALRLFAGYAGLAIENARLYTELQHELTERKQVEEALRQRDQQYQYVTLATRDAIYDWDRVNHTHTQNETYHLLYVPPSLTETDDTWGRERIHPDDQERVVSGLEKAIQERRAFWSDEFRFRRRDSNYATVMDRGYILYNEAGEAIRMIGAITDITERTQAEEARRQRDEQYHYVTLATRDAMYDWDRVNHTVIRNENYEMLYVPSTVVSTADTWWEAQIHPDDRARVIREVEEAFKERQPVWSSEYRLRRNDGSYASVLDRGYVLYNDAGEAIRMIGAVTDITERKRLEAKLAEERNLLRLLIDNLPHQIFFKDAQARFIIINMPHSHHSRVNLTSPDEVIGKTVFDLFPPDVAALYHAHDMDVLQLGKPLVNYEETRLDRHGNERRIVTNKLPLRDDAGQIIGLVGFVMDITERHKVEEQRLELALAQERADLLKDFLNTLSHDLKTPLSVINTSLYLLQKATDPDYQKRRLETIQEQAHHLEKLIQDILTMSRLDSVPDVVFVPLDVNRVVGQVREQVSTVAEGRGLTVDLDLDSDLPTVLANEEELQRALANLVENALHYTPPEGRVTVRTFQQGGQAVVEVRDTGIGIDPKDLPHIFEHFYRADRARATDTGGTGLGLAIVKRIVEMHHGSIAVDSAPGEGSTFRVSLPIKAAVPEP